MALRIHLQRGVVLTTLLLLLLLLLQITMMMIIIMYKDISPLSLYLNDLNSFVHVLRDGQMHRSSAACLMLCSISYGPVAPAPINT